MKRLAKIVFGMFLIVLFAHIAVRLAIPGAMRQAAVNQLLQAPAETGKNGMARLWFVGHELSDAQIDAGWQADKQALTTWVDLHYAQTPGSSVAPRDFQSLLGTPTLSLSASDKELFCTFDEDCVAKVAANLAVYQALIAQNTKRIQNIKEYIDTDFIAWEGPWDPVVPLADLQSVFQLLTWQAVSLLTEEPQISLANICTQIGQSRKLEHKTNSLIVQMVFMRFTQKSVQQLLTYLSRNGEVSAPAECDHALAPPSEVEGRLDSSFGGEYMWASSMLYKQTPKKLVGRIVYNFGFDIEHTNSIFATNFLRAKEHGALLRSTDSQTAEQASSECSGLEYFGNPMGCILGEIGAPAYKDYAFRAQDYRSSLQLAALAYQLFSSRHDPSAQKSLVDRLTTSSPFKAHRAFQINAERSELSINLHKSRQPVYLVNF